MKLPNGYGSIVKLGGKRRKPYAARITTSRTQDGKPITYQNFLQKCWDKNEVLKFLPTKHLPHDESSFETSLTR